VLSLRQTLRICGETSTGETVVPGARRLREQVWQSIRGSLPVYEKPDRSWIRLWRPLGWAAACALLIAVPLLPDASGSGSRRRRLPWPPTSARQRVVVVVLGDHLDRSERLLVELNHAGSMICRYNAAGRSERLLANNRW